MQARRMAPYHIIGHLKNSQYSIPRRQAEAISREINEQSRTIRIIQEPDELPVIHYISEPIPELNIHPGWRYTVESDCLYIALVERYMKNHCAKYHRGVRKRPGEPAITPNPWVRVQC